MLKCRIFAVAYTSGCVHTGANADFEFDALLGHVINAECNNNNNNLTSYKIDPVVPVPDCLPLASSVGAPAAVPPIPPHIPPSTSAMPTPALTSACSLYAPPKPGTNEFAYHKARGKACEKLKVKQCRDAASYGDFAFKLCLVNKHIKRLEKSLYTGLNPIDMPHTSTRYLGNSATHRLGEFPALAIGASFGGGQQVPGNLVNPAINATILYSLFSNITFICIAGFASVAFATWSPHLYAYYVTCLGPLLKTYPRLK